MAIFSFRLFWLFSLLIYGFGFLPAAADAELPPTFQPAPRPMPSAVLLEDGLRLELYFPALKQGGVGLLRLRGPGIESAQFSFRAEQGSFFYLAEDAWYALIVVDMDASLRDYQLTVMAERVDGQRVSFKRALRIEAAGYISQTIDLPAERAGLAEPNIEALELEQLTALSAVGNSEPLWDAGGFALPLLSPLTSPFGAFRLFNGRAQSRHTGWDQRAAVGSPIQAMAAGQVVFAAGLALRGQYALIDHGYGIFSGYAHLSELTVTAGQAVAAGQIIGLSGNSGRSSAPHLHWEILVRGQWVDGLALLDLWLPAAKNLGA